MIIKKLGAMYVVWCSIEGKPLTAIGGTRAGEMSGMNKLMLKYLSK